MLQTRALNLNGLLDRLQSMLSRLLTEDIELTVRKGQAVAGPHVLLTVSDTGVGIDDATREQIFEPFFSTKGPGRGTGLGLSTAEGTIRQSGGFIRVDSRLGEGTRFTVCLPRIADEPCEVRPTLSRAAASARGETVLVVEDSAGLRKLFRRILESAGYGVLAAADGNEALRLLERQAAPVQRLLSDVIMPGMTATEAASRMTVLQPEMKVVFMSGYSDEAVRGHGVLVEGAAFISKPFTAFELIRKIGAVLDA